MCTTNPHTADDGMDLGIVNRVREYVQSTEKGDQIHAAMYLWELHKKTPASQDLIDDLIAAQERGVGVHLVLGDTTDHRNTKALQRMREGDLDVTVCERSCLPGKSSKGPMHVKFFAIDNGETVQLAHTSSNFSIGQFQRHQNMLSISGDQKLYDDYIGYWNRLNAGSWTYEDDTWEGSDRARDSDIAGGKSYFYPRTQADPVRGTLEQLSCRQGHDRVWVAASLFDRAPVLGALNDLAASGCDVKVIVSTKQQHDWVRANSDLKNVRVLGDSDSHLSQHNKLIVTDADYHGEERDAVYAGSHNMNETNLRTASDAMLRTADSGVYEIYAAYFDDLFELAEG